MMEIRVLYIMGVSGCGKSTIGKMLSVQTGMPFFDGDDFHPQANIEKMKSGQALNDTDRQDWLLSLNELANKAIHQSGAVIACSALKEKYRNVLRQGIEASCRFVFLEGDFETIQERMSMRTGHFMPGDLLKSQFDTLEVPQDAWTFNIQQAPGTIVREIEQYLNKSAINNMNKSFGIIGLGVMGKSLARNMAGKGIALALYNRFEKGVEEKVAERFILAHDELSAAAGFEDLKAFVNALERPRKLLLMVKAGPVIDHILKELLPVLSKGDIIIDGGNSHYKDTQKRIEQLAASAIHFIGSGVSGGEEGALKGPSIMPGGDRSAYEAIAPYLEKIAARDQQDGACCAYVGPGGSGHFVKMVHNGIEYAEMQLLAEIYHLLRYGQGKSPDQIADVLERWRGSHLDNYLLEITIHILRKKEGDGWLIDQILDRAGNKGTGNWTTVAAAELGVPITMISAALFARYLSAFKPEREAAESFYGAPAITEVDFSLEQLKNAYHIARIINHHQGIHLISTAASTYGWDLYLPEIARIWTNGCIIRSVLMEELIHVLQQTDRVLTHPYFIDFIQHNRKDLVHISTATISAGLDAPCFAAAIHYLNGYTNAQSSANIIQAQRDYFGAHTYKRKDDPSGKSHHTNW